MLRRHPILPSPPPRPSPNTNPSPSPTRHLSPLSPARPVLWVTAAAELAAARLAAEQSGKPLKRLSSTVRHASPIPVVNGEGGAAGTGVDVKYRPSRSRKTDEKRQAGEGEEGRSEGRGREEGRGEDVGREERRERRGGTEIWERSCGLENGG